MRFLTNFISVIVEILTVLQFVDQCRTVIIVELQSLQIDLLSLPVII